MANQNSSNIVVPRISELAKDMANKRLAGTEKSNDRKTLGNKTQQQQPDSRLFDDENYPFYFDPSVVNELKKYIHKVFRNSGSTVPKLEYIIEKKISPKAVYCIIPDGMEDLAKSIKAAIGEKAVMYSPRWIDYCIERNAVITNARERSMVNLLPLSKPTPFPNLEEYKLAVKREDFDWDRAAALESLAKVLGFEVVTSASTQYINIHSDSISS